MDMHSMLRRAISVGRIYSLGAVAIFALAATAVPALAQDADALPSRVGRLSNAAGEIYLATQENADDWSPIQINYPVTSGDNLWAAEGARAEVDFGGSQMRMSASTNVSVSNLDDHNVEVFVAQGNVIVRVGVLDAGDSVVVDTPTTQVVLVRPGLYRIDVSPDQQQTTLTVRAGEATAQVTAGLQQVLPAMTAVIANGPETAADFSAAYPLDAFDTWNADRERYFRQASNSKYVSPEMVGYADLASYGTWQSSPDYGNVWYPSNVAAGWAPYSDGYWTTVSGFGLTWVDRAPWGYAPFHYGRWSHINGRWGWLPGTYVRRPVWAPALVAWTGGGITIGVSGGPVYGWVPLGWREPYRPWWGGCSGNCWDRYNRPYHVDERDRDRYRDHAPPPDHYANWRVPGAVSAVAGANLIARKPYTGNERVMALTGSQLTSAQVANSAPPIVKPSPGRIPTVRPGSQGTPRPASTFYSASKPAQMGLQHHGSGRGVNNKPSSANQTLLNATGSPAKPNTGNANNRAGPATATNRAAPGKPAQPNARDNVAAPTQPGNAAADAGKSPRPAPGNAGTRAPANNAAQSHNAPAPRIVTPPANAGPANANNANGRPPRPQSESRIINAPPSQAAPNAGDKGSRNRAEPNNANNQGSRNRAEPNNANNQTTRNNAESGNANQSPRSRPAEPRANPSRQAEQRALPPQPQQQVIRTPPPQPQPAVRPAPGANVVVPQQPAANQNENPNAQRGGKGNDDHNNRPGRPERDNGDKDNKDKGK